MALGAHNSVRLKRNDRSRLGKDTSGKGEHVVGRRHRKQKREQTVKVWKMRRVYDRC